MPGYCRRLKFVDGQSRLCVSKATHSDFSGCDYLASIIVDVNDKYADLVSEEQVLGGLHVLLARPAGST